MKYCIILMLCGFALAKKRYDGHRLVSAFPKNAEDVKVLQEMELDGGYEELDFWTKPSRIRPTDIRVSPNDFERFRGAMTNAGIEFTVKNENIQMDIELEEEYMRLARFTGEVCNYREIYCNFDEVNFHIDFLLANYPEHVEVKTIGYSYYNYPIRQVKIAQDLTVPKYGIYAEAATHAREWITVSAALNLINTLATANITNNADAIAMLAKYDWYVIVVHNPDGYIYSHTTERYWRKNRSPCFGTQGVGVDLNRNWGVKFGETGTSTRCRDDIYGGPMAFSELETSALRNEIMSNTRAFAFFAVHSYGEMIIIPYAYDYNKKPVRYNELFDAALAMNSAIVAVNGTSFALGTAPDLLSPASGGSDDYMYYIGVPFSYTFELRPRSSWEGGFALPENQIYVASLELYQALKAFAALDLQWPHPDVFPEELP